MLPDRRSGCGPGTPSGRPSLRGRGRRARGLDARDGLRRGADVPRAGETAATPGRLVRTRSARRGEGDQAEDGDRAAGGCARVSLVARIPPEDPLHHAAASSAGSSSARTAIARPITSTRTAGPVFRLKYQPGWAAPPSLAAATIIASPSGKYWRTDRPLPSRPSAAGGQQEGIHLPGPGDPALRAAEDPHAERREPLVQAAVEEQADPLLARDPAARLGRRATSADRDPP